MSNENPSKHGFRKIGTGLLIAISIAIVIVVLVCLRGNTAPQPANAYRLLTKEQKQGMIYADVKNRLESAGLNVSEVSSVNVAYTRTIVCVGSWGHANICSYNNVTDGVQRFIDFCKDRHIGAVLLYRCDIDAEIRVYAKFIENGYEIHCHLCIHTYSVRIE